MLPASLSLPHWLRRSITHCIIGVIHHGPNCLVLSHCCLVTAFHAAEARELIECGTHKTICRASLVPFTHTHPAATWFSSHKSSLHSREEMLCMTFWYFYHDENRRTRTRQSKRRRVRSCHHLSPECSPQRGTVRRGRGCFSQTAITRERLQVV